MVAIVLQLSFSYRHYQHSHVDNVLWKNGRLSYCDVFYILLLSIGLIIYIIDQSIRQTHEITKYSLPDCIIVIKISHSIQTACLSDVYCA